MDKMHASHDNRKTIYFELYLELNKATIRFHSKANQFAYKDSKATRKSKQEQQTDQKWKDQSSAILLRPNIM